MTWFKCDNNICEDDKLAIIARRAGVPAGIAVAFWVLLLGKVSAENPDSGVVPQPDFETADFTLGIEDGCSQKIFNAMILKGIVFKREDNEYVVTNWEKYQEVSKRENRKEQMREYSRQRYQDRKIEKENSIHSINSIISPMIENNSIPREEKRREEERREEENREEKKRVEEREKSVRGERESTTDNSDELPLVVTDKPSCPQKQIISLYHSTLPELPVVKVWNKNRETLLRTRWNEDANRQDLSWWQSYFNLVKSSDFLTGKVNSRDRPPFLADLEWLLKPSNMAKVLEGKYDNRPMMDDIDRTLKSCIDLGYDGVVEKYNEMFGVVENG